MTTFPSVKGVGEGIGLGEAVADGAGVKVRVGPVGVGEGGTVDVVVGVCDGVAKVGVDKELVGSRGKVCSETWQSSSPIRCWSSLGEMKA